RAGSRAHFRRVAMPSTRRRLLQSLPALGAAVLLLAHGPAEAARLKVGVTLHPYYSFAANIVGDLADVVPLIDADANPHGYMPQPDDMIRITTMDVLIVN